jgi:hypothetical protein
VHARLSSRFPAALLFALGVLPTALAAQAPTAAPSPWSVGVTAYTQYVYQDAPIHANSFDVKRAYINVIGRFSGGIYTRITADIYNPPAVTGDSSRTYRIKYAYFAYTPTGSALTYKLGEIHTPLLDWEEALWDYRMQGQMAMERGGYVTSADFGAGVDGKWGLDKVNAQLTIVNGEGYSRGQGDFRKDALGRVSVRVLNTNDSSRVGGLRVTAYAGIGKPNGGGTRTRFLGMVSYRSKQITLAGEFGTVVDSVTAGAHVPARVISGFGVYHLPNSKVALIARVDLTDPNTNTANNKQTRIIGGVSYQLSPNVRLLADLDRVSFESGATARNQVLFQAQFNF